MTIFGLTQGLWKVFIFFFLGFFKHIQVIGGSAQLVSVLVAAKADVNERYTSTMADSPELLLGEMDRVVLAYPVFF